MNSVILSKNNTESLAFRAKITKQAYNCFTETISKIIVSPPKPLKPIKPV